MHYERPLPESCQRSSIFREELHNCIRSFQLLCRIFLDDYLTFPKIWVDYKYSSQRPIRHSHAAFVTVPLQFPGSSDLFEELL